MLAVYGIGQLLENYVLVPYLVGDRIGLHPLAVIFALLAFGQLFGFAGVLLALPVSAALLVGAAPPARARTVDVAACTATSGMARMEQLIFELAPPEPPSFANFVAGRNAEALAALAALAAGRGARPASCCGAPPASARRTCCARRCAAATAAGRSAVYVAEPGALDADPPGAGAPALVAVDRVEAADADAQARLFTLYNALRAAGGQLLVAAGAAPAALPLRDDLRTRLGWGLVLRGPAAGRRRQAGGARAYARLRGFPLSDDVIAYLLAHGRRDMATLVATLAALDRHSLATRAADHRAAAARLAAAGHRVHGAPGLTGRRRPRRRFRRRQLARWRDGRALPTRLSPKLKKSVLIENNALPQRAHAPAPLCQPVAKHPR